jgi:hypothetical protein
MLAAHHSGSLVRSLNRSVSSDCSYIQLSDRFLA